MSVCPEQIAGADICKCPEVMRPVKREEVSRKPLACRCERCHHACVVCLDRKFQWGHDDEKTHEH